MQEPFSFDAPARLVDFMRQADLGGVINLAAGVPGPDALPAATLREAFEEVYHAEGAAIYGYHHPEGDRELRDLLAARLRARGVSRLGGGEIVITTGCTQALQLMLAVLVKPGDTVACEAPAYYGLLELIAAMGARILPLPVNGIAGLDPEAARPLLERWKPKCLVVCTSLSNPSGATLPPPARRRLVEICRETGVRLIEDDIYGELSDGGAPVPCLAHDDGSTVSYVTSFSKTVAPALRVGYCVPGTPELHDAFATKKCQQDLHGSVIPEVTLRRFIQRGSLDPHLDWLRERNRGRRRLVLEAIGRSFPEGTRVEAPEGGFMLWAELPRGTDLPMLRERAREQGVVFAAGSAFFAETPGAPPCSRRFVRLNAARADEEGLVRGVETLGRLVAEIAP